jgi:hypothetical protein
MTNGPNARVAEIVENTLPKSRARTDMHKHPNYYPLRNHLIDFLVTRSAVMARGEGSTFDPRHPPLVRPTHVVSAVGTPVSLQREGARADASPTDLSQPAA